MKLITPQTLACGAAERWAQQYANTDNQEFRSITKKLRELGPMPTTEQVNATIGNTSWTQMPACDECGKESPAFVVEVGQEPDYDSATARLCGRCIGKLARMIAHPSTPTTHHEGARRE